MRGRGGHIVLLWLREHSEIGTVASLLALAGSFFVPTNRGRVVFLVVCGLATIGFGLIAVWREAWAVWVGGPLALIVVLACAYTPFMRWYGRVQLHSSGDQRIWLWLSSRSRGVEALTTDNWAVVRKAVWSRPGFFKSVCVSILIPPRPGEDGNPYAGVEVCEPLENGHYLIQLSVGRDGGALLRERGEKTVGELPAGTIDTSQWSVLRLRRRLDTYEASVDGHRLVTRPLQVDGYCLWPPRAGVRLRVGARVGVTLEALFSRPHVS